jgi:UDPglucose 6-dehydrogenase|tara:strand:- start:11563 stop:12348 length:786 start_codon:yes stop_codon:yes gene_type:complete
MSTKKLKIAIIGESHLADAMSWLFTVPTSEVVHFADVDILTEWNPNLTLVCCEPNYTDFSEVENIILKTLKHTDSGVLVKTPIPPKATAAIIKTIGTINKVKKLVFSPDFSTTDNALDGTINPNFQILGGHPDATRAMMEVMRTTSNLNKCEFHLCGALEASIIKLASNSFLATKVTFFNQLYNLLEQYDCNWPIVSRALAADTRIGVSHTKVPGKDLKKGYGDLFEKDVRILLESSDDAFTLLKECQEINEYYRNEDATI